jgi:hypothetical protein
MSRFLIRAAVIALLLALSACGSMNAKRSPRDAMLYEYVSAIRWSDFDRAVGFVDPLTLAQDPVESIELERYKQFQVTGYEVRTGNEPVEGQYEQVVEIRMVNKHTQAEKMLVDRQTWRWDEEAGRWWLTSGLPNLDDLHTE